MTQEPNQHGHEEDDVNDENAESIDEAPVSTLDDAGLQKGVIQPVNLLNLDRGEVRISNTRTSVERLTIVKSFTRASIGDETTARTTENTERTPNVKGETTRPNTERDERHDEIAVPYRNSETEETR